LGIFEEDGKSYIGNNDLDKKYFIACQNRLVIFDKITKFIIVFIINLAINWERFIQVLGDSFIVVIKECKCLNSFLKLRTSNIHIRCICIDHGWY